MTRGRKAGPSHGRHAVGRKHRGAVDFLRGVAALAVLCGLLIGVPILLYVVAGSPIPAKAPNLDDITATLSRRDDGTLFLGIVKVVTWGAWAIFVLVCLSEGVAQVRGRSVPRLPAIGSMQHTAGRLIASAALVVGPGSSAALAATPPPPPAVLEVPMTHVEQAGQPLGSAEGQPGEPRNVAAPSPLEGPDEHPRTVKRGDTLWDIAEDEYGAGQRYPEIYKASRRLDQPDGIPDLRDPDLIFPGMRISIPGAERDPEPGREPKSPPHKAEPGGSAGAPRERAPSLEPSGPTSEPGATTAPTKTPRETGSPTTAPREEGAGSPTKNPGQKGAGAPTTAPSQGGAGAPTTAPSQGGAGAPTTAPSQGRAGAPTTAPREGGAGSPTKNPGQGGQAAPREGGAPTTGTERGAGAPTAGPRTGDTGAPTAQPSGSGRPTSSPRAGEPSTEPPGSNETDSPSPSASAPEPVQPPIATPRTPRTFEPRTPDSQAPTGSPTTFKNLDSEELSTSVIVGYSALLAAGVLALLGLKRLIQRRRRRPGQRIVMPESMSDTELEMRANEEPASIELLDQGLRWLSAELSRRDEVLPGIFGARVTADDVELLLTEPATPTQPFIAVDETTWRLDRAEAFLPEISDQEIPAPYPALVTLGDRPNGSHVLLDLTTYGALTLGGQLSDVQDVLTALAIEMATSPWADHIVVTCVGFAAELPRALGTGRLRHVETMSEALLSFEARADEVREVLAASGAASIEEARTRQVGGDAWTPEIIISVEEPDPDESERIARLVTAEPGLNLAAVVRASPDSILSAGCHLDATPFQYVTLGPLPLDITLQRVTSAQYGQLLHDLRMAGDASGVPSPEWRDVPPEREDVLQPVETPAGTGVPAAATAGKRVTSSEVGRSELTIPLNAPVPPSGTAMSTAPPATGHPTAPFPLPESRPTSLDKTPPASSRAGDARTSHPLQPPEDETPVEPEVATETPRQDELDPPDVLIWRGPASPEIRVLGRVHVAGRDVHDIEAGKQNVLVELAAFLKLNPGCSAAEVSSALGARRPWSASTRASSMSRLRAWLGRDPAGRNYVPAQGEGKLYTMLGSVRCDWDVFQDRAKRGLARGRMGEPDLGIPDLRAALDLVQGHPFSGAGPASYAWAEHIKQQMLSAIVDVAHALATRLIEIGDAAGARTAIAKGLQIEPGSELLYRDLFRAEHRAGNAPGIDQAAERLMITLYELDLEMEPETVELLDQLRAQRRPRR